MKNSLTQRVRATGALLGVLGVAIIVTAALNAVGMPPLALYASTYLVLGIMAVALRRSGWFTSRWNDTRDDEPIHAGHDLRPTGSHGTLVSIGIGVALSVATMFWTAHHGETTPAKTSHTPAEVLAIVLLAPAVGPIVEELVFRGVVYPVLRRGFGIIVSTLVSAGLFSLTHADAREAVYTFAIGIVLALTYETSRRLKDVMIAHVAHNVMSMVFVGLNPGEWMNDDVARVVAVIIWAAIVLGVYEHVTMKNDVKGGYRLDTRRDERETDESIDEVEASDQPA